MVVGEFTVETDLAVIGGGPGGYSAAFRAAELGIETTIIDDRETLGGMWLHEGCMLSKELLHLADTIRAAEHAAAFGIVFGRPSIDLSKLRSGLRETVESFAGDLDALCLEHGVNHVKGRARFENSRQLAVAGNPDAPRIRFRRAVIAAGSEPVPLGGAPMESPRVMGLCEALELKEIPATLLIVGGSASALELASIYAALGSRVTLVCKSARLAPHADLDLLEPLGALLGRTLEQVCLSTGVGRVDESGHGVKVEFAGEKTPRRRKYDRVLIAAGRRPHIDELGLKSTKVRLNGDGSIQVDKQLRTTDPRILAVGDVIGEPMLALKATHQGRIAAEVVADWGSEFDARVVPMVLFTDPQLAWCGLTEAEAVDRGMSYEVQRTRWAAAGQTTGAQRSEGFTKIIYEPDAQLILGMGVVGPNAAELIAEGALAIEMGAVVTDIAATIHPHPTHSEFLCDAAQQADAASPPDNAGA